MLSWPSASGFSNGTGNLYIADTNNHRVLFYATPLTTDTTADQVFGQAGSFTTAGTVSVTVFNPAPGGGTSSATLFTITATTSGQRVLLPLIQR